MGAVNLETLFDALLVKPTTSMGSAAQLLTKIRKPATPTKRVHLHVIWGNARLTQRTRVRAFLAKGTACRIHLIQLPRLPAPIINSQSSGFWAVLHHYD